MPPQSRPRRPGNIVSYGDSDSDGDTERDTPKPPRHGLKKRLSEHYSNNADASFTSDSGRTPLQVVNMNDDAAEKRRRRKSHKLTVLDNAHASTSSETPQADQNPAETSKVAHGRGRQVQLLASVVPTPAVAVPLDVMSSNFEEWMKLATDNKINAANSWNFALIDYFHDMSLLRNIDDNSINFQRASCTLDGCVKIWTSRVDSVGTETGKLLSNLANEGRATDDDDEDQASDNPDAQDSHQPRKRNKTHRSEATLAKSVEQLKSKKLDLEFSVDPLFKKTCADFDEGGAQGLLMNHLSLGVSNDGGLRVVFDAGDSIGKIDDDDEDQEDPQEYVDLSYLRSEFFPDLDILESKAISHSLADFSFSKDSFAFDDTTFFREDTKHDAMDDDDDNHFNSAPIDFGVVSAPMEVEGTAELPVEDFFVGDQAVDDDFAGDGGMTDDFGAGGNNVPASAEARQNQAGARPAVFVPFDPRRAPNERDLIMAMTDNDADGGMMDYFDQNFLKNWAGPEHWKLRKVVRKPDPTDAAAPKAERKKKDAFRIDFLTPAEKDLKQTAKQLFAPVSRGAGITLPGVVTSKPSSRRSGRTQKAREKRPKVDDHTLPDDMHFSSRQLVTLFLKPKFSLKMRGQRVRFDENGDGEVDENFWAQAAADQAAGRVAQEGDETEDGGAIPFNTQFFHDDYDDLPGFEDVFDGDGDGIGPTDEGAEDQDLLAATQGQTRKVRPAFVNYAKRAKRVDVRKLKENIWKTLDIQVAKVKDDDDDRMETDDVDITDPSEARVFSSVISGLQRSYPKEKMDDISTSFCFICLLHLANERGLKLETSSQDDAPRQSEADEDDIVKDAKIVGDIWSLKIYRDPLATESA